MLDEGLSTIDGLEYWLKFHSLETVIEEMGCCWYGGAEALASVWQIVRETDQSELLEHLLSNNRQVRVLATRRLEAIS